MPRTVAVRPSPRSGEEHDCTGRPDPSGDRRDRSAGQRLRRIDQRSAEAVGRRSIYHPRRLESDQPGTRRTPRGVVPRPSVAGDSHRPRPGRSIPGRGSCSGVGVRRSGLDVTPHESAAAVKGAPSQAGPRRALPTLVCCVDLGCGTRNGLRDLSGDARRLRCCCDRTTTQAVADRRRDGRIRCHAHDSHRSCRQFGRNVGSRSCHAMVLAAMAGSARHSSARADGHARIDNDGVRHFSMMAGRRR